MFIRQTTSLCRTAVVARSQCVPAMRAFSSHSFSHTVTSVKDQKMNLFKAMTTDLATSLADKKITQEDYNAELANLNTTMKNGTFPLKAEPKNYEPALDTLPFLKVKELMESSEIEKMSSYDVDYYLAEAVKREPERKRLDGRYLALFLVLAWPLTQTALKLKFEKDYPGGHYAYDFPMVYNAVKKFTQ